MICLVVLILFVSATVAGAVDPLPSWNDSASKQSIVAFVQQVTDPESPDFVPPAGRIATLDNDGTLWSEKPIYFQLAFAIDRVGQLAPEHPEWKSQQPFQAILEGDRQTVSQFGVPELLQLMMASHAGMSTDEFAQLASDWLATARHPRFNRPHTGLTYAPMVELLEYLRANGFKTYIVSGGGIEFLRVFAEDAYGIPPEQVIGTSIKTSWDDSGDEPRLMREAEIDFIDDKEGKPIAINRFIGRRPIAAFGNSDGDLQMLEWTAAGEGARLCVLVRHTDAEREWAYDRESPVGRLDKALDEAIQRGWTIVDMARDWRTVYAPAE